MLIAIGSTNPVKINAVKDAFQTLWPNKNWQFKGIQVSSGVSNQPTSEQETIKGAFKRAKDVLAKLNADYGIGMEAELQKIERVWFNTGWVVVIDKKGKVGIASMLRVMVPEKIIALIKKGGV